MNCLFEPFVLLNMLYVVSSIEHPSSDRQTLQVVVAPKDSFLRPGESVVVECLVDAGVRRDHLPTIGIYLQLDESTVLPLSSDIPGVTVRTVGITGAGTFAKLGRYSKSITYITIGDELYDILPIAENHFACVASTSAGENQQDFFTVWKTSDPV